MEGEVSGIRAGGSRSLRRAREAAGVTQAALAEALVVNHATVSRWESGTRRPPHDLVAPLAQALGVPVWLVASWFAGAPFLKGDGIGAVPGLKRLLQDHGVGIEDAAAACGVSVELMRGWVCQRRTLQRFAVEPLADLLRMDAAAFVKAARVSAGPAAGSGALLRRARLAQRLTQDQVGVRVGVVGETVSHWERGTWKPPVHQVFRLAAVVRVDPWDLAMDVGVVLPDREDPDGQNEVDRGHRVRLARLRAGLTRAQLARCIGVRSATVGRWEAGLAHPRGIHRRRLAIVLEWDDPEPDTMRTPSPRKDTSPSPPPGDGQRCG